MIQSFIQMLAVCTAIAASTFAVYYALNGGEHFHFVDLQRNRREDEAFQPAIHERPNQVDAQDNDNPCGICNRNIRNTEYDLTTLSCNHNFHCRCICDHLRLTALNETIQESACPLCQTPYSIADITI